MSTVCALQPNLRCGATSIMRVLKHSTTPPTRVGVRVCVHLKPSLMPAIMLGHDGPWLRHIMWQPQQAEQKFAPACMNAIIGNKLSLDEQFQPLSSIWPPSTIWHCMPSEHCMPQVDVPFVCHKNLILKGLQQCLQRTCAWCAAGCVCSINGICKLNNDGCTHAQNGMEGRRWGKASLFVTKGNTNRGVAMHTVALWGLGLRCKVGAWHANKTLTGNRSKLTMPMEFLLRVWLLAACFSAKAKKAKKKKEQADKVEDVDNRRRGWWNTSETTIWAQTLILLWMLCIGWNLNLE